MKKAGEGKIVNISSGAGLRPSLTNIQGYTTAKHAQIGLTKQLALELGPEGINVNSVAPGFVRSNPSTETQWVAYERHCACRGISVLRVFVMDIRASPICRRWVTVGVRRQAVSGI
jgi:NAD(P)-dependent dehydrogenase (short-subunit alcohol dehydrogenase family)